MDKDKGIVYSNQVRLGNWYEAATLEEYKLNKFLEQMKRGDLMLARFRKMTENLTRPTILTQTTGAIEFGARISLRAPHVPSSDPPVEGKNGLMLGGRITSMDITYSQDLEDGCSVVAVPDQTPAERNTFVITSADYCNRNGEQLKYNQEFLLTLSSSLKKKFQYKQKYCGMFTINVRLNYTDDAIADVIAGLIRDSGKIWAPKATVKVPLYLRYDPNPIPGLCGMFPLYLSQHYVSNTRWRILPVQRPNITRFEQEGDPVMVNTDVVINHCATNLNLGVHVGCWAMGFYGKICAPLMKTCLDIYGKELPNNIWQIYIPIAEEKIDI